MPNMLLHGGSIVRQSGNERLDVLLEPWEAGLRITAIAPSVPPRGAKKIDVSGKLLFPGLIDCHVHFREPGYEHKGTIRTESESARAGGVMAVCEMPNTDPPTVTIEALRDKVERARKTEQCDVRFFFGITDSSHCEEFKRLMESEDNDIASLRLLCCGVKLYLDHSTGNQKAEDSVLDEAFALCAKFAIPLVCHCEDSEMNAKAAAQNTRTDVAAHSQIRSAQSEASSIERAIDLARTHGTHLHVAHISTANGLDLIRKAKAEGLTVTCEVTPHHLFLVTDDYERLGTLMKVNPPIRSYEHRDALWKGVEDGTIDCIATDHAPHTLEEKGHPEVLRAPSGVPGVETMLPLLLTVAGGSWPNPIRLHQSPYRLSYADIVRLCFENPNRIFGLGHFDISEGATTDIVVVDPDREWTITAGDLHSKCGWTPFEGWYVRGRVEKVIGE